MTSTLKDAQEGKTSAGTDPDLEEMDAGIRAAEGSGEEAVVSPEVTRIAASKAKDPTDYMILREMTDRPERVGVFGEWELLAICSASGDRQAVRVASEEFGPGSYAAVALFHWRNHTTAKETVEQLRFVGE